MKHCSKALVLLLLAVEACGDGVEADPSQSNVGTSCPCASGYFCCASNICAKDEASCESTTAAALLAQAKGVWTGYVENYQFPSQSDKVSLSFAAGSDGSTTGKVVLGEGTPPVPATDGTVLWPSRDLDLSKNFFSFQVDLLEGFTYTAADIRWEQQRIKFMLKLTEPWQPWCVLRPSVSTGHGEYGCMEGWGLGYVSYGRPNCFLNVNGKDEPFDCYTAALCARQYQLCTCDETGCNAKLQDDHNGSVESVEFDIALRDGVGDGSVRGFGGEALHNNVRVTRIDGDPK